MANSITSNSRHHEGPLAKAIEKQTAKLPSDTFLWAAFACIGASLALKVMKKNDLSIFVGQWPAAFLLLGLYNKIVKVEGHDKDDSGDF